MNLIENRKTNIKFILIVILLSILSAIYFYTQLINTPLPIHSDDAATAVDFENLVNMGYDSESLSAISYIRYINPFFWLNFLFYSIFGFSEIFIQSFFTFKFFLCIFLTLILALSNERNNRISWNIIPLFLFFLAMPDNSGLAGIQVLKFHTEPIIYFLICLLFLHNIYLSHRKIRQRDYIIIGALCFFGLTALDILFFLVVILPLVTYKMIIYIQKGYLKKYAKPVLAILIVCILLGKYFFGNISYGGYGSRNFGSVEEVWSNIAMAITGILTMFNIPLIGKNIIQFESILYFIRILLLCAALIIVVKICVSIVKRGIESVEPLEAIIVLSILYVFCGYLFSGYQSDAISVRYMISIYYLLGIILCRNAVNVFGQPFFLYKNKINMLSLCFFCLIIVYLNPVKFSKNFTEIDEYVEILKSNKELENGMGGFWSANVASLLSDGENQVQSAELLNGQVYPNYNIWEYYKSGKFYYNFIVEDLGSGSAENQTFGLNRENIINIYGEPVKVYSGGNRNIYQYDYDIRTVPLKIDFNKNNEYLYFDTTNCTVRNKDVLIPGQKQFGFFGGDYYVGKIVIEFTGKQIDKLELSIDEEVAKIVKVKKISGDKDSAVYSMEVNGTIYNMAMLLTNKSHYSAQIESCTIKYVKRAYESQDISKETNIYCGAGNYDITIWGNMDKNAEAIFEYNGTPLLADHIVKGKKRIVYKVDLPQDGELSVKILGTGVDSFSIETPYAIRTVDKGIDFYMYNGGILTNDLNNVGKDDILVLENGDLTYGPYIELKSGTYLCSVIGENLQEANVSFTYENGQKRIENYVVRKKTNTALLYEITLGRDIEKFEIVVTNSSSDKIKVKSYCIYRLSDTIRFTNSNGIVSNSPLPKDTVCRLNKNEYIYGPYTSLKRGKYVIKIKGSGLKNAEFRFTVEMGSREIKNVDCLKTTDSFAEYRLEIDEDVDDFEVIIKNNSDKEIVVAEYLFRQLLKN